MTTQSENPYSGWRLFLTSMWRRAMSPLKEPTYIFYFLVCMLAGAIGIWAAITEAWLDLGEDRSLFKILSHEGTFKAIVTFFVALGSASCAKIIMTEDKEKHLRGLFTLLLFVFASMAIVAFVVGYKNPTGGLPLAAIGTGLAVFTWWIANWDDHSYGQDAGNPTLGGSPRKDAAGDTEGFTV